VDCPGAHKNDAIPLEQRRPPACRGTAEAKPEREARSVRRRGRDPQRQGGADPLAAAIRSRLPHGCECADLVGWSAACGPRVGAAEQVSE